MHVSAMPLTSMIVYGGAGLAVYFLFLVLYRLFFHPLANFPGAKLAAATLWYEFYYDAILRGQYTFKIQEMHDRYGPIVRISPAELHCNDPSFLDTLYSGATVRRDKYPFFTRQFLLPESMFGSISHDLHRSRRGAVGRFFTRGFVLKTEHMIHEKVEFLREQLSTYLGDKNPVNIGMAFGCLTADLVTEYSFAENLNLLDDRLFRFNYNDALKRMTFMGQYTKHFPFLISIAYLLLKSGLLAILSPGVARYLEWNLSIRKQICEIKPKIDTGKRVAGDTSHPTIFDEILGSNLPESEKSVDRLWHEFQSIIGAGTDTVSWTLSVIAFFILNDRTQLETLMAELENAIPDPASRPSWSDLERLPYLSGCINEGLRLSYGLASRLPRISPDGPMVYRPSDLVTTSKSEYVIPQGTPVGMTSVLLHNNPKIFPNPEQYDPSRWMTADGKIDKTQEKYLFAFSKGSRQCIGINLAHAELFITVARIFRTFGRQMKLYETTRDDVDVKHACFLTSPRLDSKGIRVLMG